MTKCIMCGAENDGSAAFCGNCGNSLKNDSMRVNSFVPQDGTTKNETDRMHSDNKPKNSPHIFPQFTLKHLTKKTKLLLCALGVLLIAVITVLIIYNAPPHFSSGNYWENRRDFGITDSSDSDVARAYAEQITYNVLETKKTGTNEGWVVIGVEVPDVRQAIIDAVDDAVSQNDLEYEDMKSRVTKQLAQSIKSGNFPMERYTIRMDIQREGLNWKIVPNQEWIDAIGGNLLSLYSETINSGFANTDPPELPIPQDDEEEE